MSDDLETIRKLIRLATDKSATEAESRTAALKACKLMVEKKVELVPFSRVDAPEVSSVKEEPRHYPWKPPSEGWIDPSTAEAFGFGRGHNRPSSRHVPPSHPEARRRKSKFYNAGVSAGGVPGTFRVPDPSREVVRAHTEGACSECGERIALGNKVAVRPKTSDQICMRCYEEGKGYDEYGT